MKKPLLTSLLCTALLMLLRAGALAAAQAPTQAELHRAVAAAMVCESGQSAEPFRQLEDWVRLSISQSALRAQVETGLIKLLAPEATVEARRFACKQLAIIGTADALPALAGLLSKPETAGFACLALTTYPPGRADETLRAALDSAQGLARIQIINTLGDRQDANSVPLFVAAAWGADRALAEAGIAALGKVGNTEARQAIASLRQGAAPALQRVVLEATLRCADRLAAGGDRQGAAALYEALLAPRQPASVRRSAFAALLRL
jgi:hypothetical protein